VRRRIGLANLLLAADLGGTFVFALEGALIASRAGLDLLAACRSELADRHRRRLIERYEACFGRS
jgi:hypothetical protein